jgi:uncharacterized membrane protein
MESKIHHIFIGIGNALKSIITGVISGILLSVLSGVISYYGSYSIYNRPLLFSFSIFNLLSFLPSLFYILIIFLGFKDLHAGSVAYIAGWMTTMGLLVYFKILTGVNAFLDFDVPLMFVGLKFGLLLLKPGTPKSD